MLGNASWITLSIILRKFVTKNTINPIWIIIRRCLMNFTCMRYRLVGEFIQVLTILNGAAPQGTLTIFAGVACYENPVTSFVQQDTNWCNYFGGSWRNNNKTTWIQCYHKQKTSEQWAWCTIVHSSAKGVKLANHKYGWYETVTGTSVNFVERERRQYSSGSALMYTAMITVITSLDKCKQEQMIQSA